MADDGIIAQPRLPQMNAPPIEIAPTPNVSEAAVWSGVDSRVPQWPLWLILAMTLVLVFASLQLPPRALSYVIHEIGIANVVWFLGAYLPLVGLLWIASTRLFRCVGVVPAAVPLLTLPGLLR